MTTPRSRQRTDCARGRRVALVVCIVAVVCLVLVAVAGPPAAAQDGANNTTIEDVAPYYDNSSYDVDNGSWMEGNADGNDPAAIITMLSRIPTFVVGDAGQSSSLLMGMLLFGAMIGAVVRVRVGLIGGGVLSVLSVFGIVAVGLAPQWLLPVIVFGVGLVLTTIYRGVFR